MKQLLFELLGKHPEAIIANYWTGPDHQAQAMLHEARQLIPNRKHIVISVGTKAPITGIENIILKPGNEYLQLRRALRHYRIGMAPVLFTKDKQHAPLRAAAFAHNPTKILAYNENLERHHLQPSTPIASYLFWQGLPLDRIWLRPKFWPGKREHSTYPNEVQILEGRPASPARAKAGILTPFFPYPLSHGGAVRLYNLLKEAALTHDLTLFAFTEKESSEDLQAMRDICAKIITVAKPRYREPRWASLNPPEVNEYHSPAMQRAIAEQNLPVLEVEFTQLAAYSGDILVEHDLTHDLYHQVYQRTQTLSTWWDWQRWQRFERKALRSAKRVVVMSDKDREQSGCAHAITIPNGVDLARFKPTPEPATRRVLFIGSFRHFPNVLAFQFLIEQVWPQIKNAELTVVAGPNPELYYPQATTLPPNVTMLGFVSDVRPLYEQANLAVVPTLVSAGTNIKVLEAMAMQRTVVSTTSGCAGLGLKHGETVWIADGPTAFIEGLTTLLNDPQKRQTIAAAARNYAEKHYSWSSLGDLQRQLLSEFSPPPVSIRKATEHDHQTIGNHANNTCLIAEKSGHTVGFLAMRQTAPDECEILDIMVTPDHRRQGTGHRLLAEAIKQTQGNMFLEVRESNIAAKALYERLGFHIVGRRPEYYSNPTETALVMKLEL